MSGSPLYLHWKLLEQSKMVPDHCQAIAWCFITNLNSISNEDLELFYWILGEEGFMPQGLHTCFQKFFEEGEEECVLASEVTIEGLKGDTGPVGHLLYGKRRTVRLHRDGDRGSDYSRGRGNCSSPNRLG